MKSVASSSLAFLSLLASATAWGWSSDDHEHGHPWGPPAGSGHGAPPALAPVTVTATTTTKEVSTTTATATVTATAAAAQGAGICSGPPPQLKTGGSGFNATEWQKWNCLTVEKYFNIIPACAQQCEHLALANDGCAYDDFVCHCNHYQQIATRIEPCIFPPSLGGKSVGNCSFADLGKLRGIVTDQCTFYNATGYADYAGCPASLQLELTTELYEDVNKTACDGISCGTGVLTSA